jgi:hypothetical protein
MLAHGSVLPLPSTHMLLAAAAAPPLLLPHSASGHLWLTATYCCFVVMVGGGRARIWVSTMLAWLADELAEERGKTPSPAAPPSEGSETAGVGSSGACGQQCVAAAMQEFVDVVSAAPLGNLRPT